MSKKKTTKDQESATPTAEVASEDDYFASLMTAGTVAPAETAMVTLSATAAEKVRSLLEQENDPTLALRVFVAGGGCSGLQYGMTLDEEQDGDTIISGGEGIRVVVDEMSAQYLSGSEIDYVDSLMGAGFTVNNPNAVSTCGCGHSFKTSGDSGQARSCGCGF